MRYGGLVLPEHNLSDHKLPFDYELMNKAADYVINDQLVVAKIGSMPEGGQWCAKKAASHQPFCQVTQIFRHLTLQSCLGMSCHSAWRSVRPIAGGGGLPL